MKLRLLFMWYMIKLGLPLRMFTYPVEWYYDYANMSDADVLTLMASILAGRHGCVAQFDLRWDHIKKKHFRYRENINDLELIFKNKVGLHNDY